MKLKNCFLIMVLWLCHVVLLAKPAPRITQTEKPTWLRPITKSPQKINADDISMGYYFDLIESQYHLGLETYYSKTIKVLFDDNGIENAGQEYISFDPEYRKLVIHEFYLERDGKKLNRLDLTKFSVLATENDLSRSIYNGQYTAHTVIDDLRKGDKVVLAYSIIGFNPVFEGKFANSYFLQSGEPIGLVHLNYVVPDGRNILFKTHAGAKVGKQEKIKGHTQYVWEEPTEGGSEYEEWVPSWFQKNAWVECSEFSTWRQVSEWAMRVNPTPTLSNTSDIRKFTTAIWNEVSGEKYKFIERCVNFVQNEVRYMGIEMGQHSHRAHHPDKVFKQRYGDCKDKSVLLAAMLEDKGIETSIVLANTYQYRGLDDQLPSPFSFNHMVLMIKLDHELKLIDPTITNQGGPVDLRYFPYYGEVLICTQGTKLTAVEKPALNKVFEENIIVLGEDGSATLSVNTRFEGGEADLTRSMIKETGKTQLYKDYEAFYTKLFDHAERKNNLIIEDDLVNNTITIKESYFIKKIVFTEDDGQLSIPAFSSASSDLLPKINENRVSPIALNYPTDRSHIIKIVNKDNKPVGNYHFNKFFDRKAYRIAQNVFTNKDTLIVDLAVEFHEPFIDSGDIKEYLSDISQRDIMFFYSYFLNKDGYLSLGDFSNFQLSIVPFTYCLLIVILSSLLWLFKIQKIKPKALSAEMPIQQYSEVGGWMILFLIGLCISVLRSIYELFSSESFLNAHFLEMVSSGIENKSLLQFFIVFILTYLPIEITSSVFIIYYFLKRRDFIPLVIVLFLIFNLSVQLITVLILEKLNADATELRTMYSDVFRILFSFIIWGTYFYRSKRVKGTFTVSYTNQYINKVLPEEPTESIG